MKLSNWFRSLSLQEKLMLITIILLVVGIVSRWTYISVTASDAIKRRFIPPTEQQSTPTDSTSNEMRLESLTPLENPTI